jgi:hypothetical protein
MWDLYAQDWPFSFYLAEIALLTDRPLAPYLHWSKRQICAKMVIKEYFLATITIFLKSRNPLRRLRLNCRVLFYFQSHIIFPIKERIIFLHLYKKQLYTSSFCIDVLFPDPIPKALVSTPCCTKSDRAYTKHSPFSAPRRRGWSGLIEGVRV